MDRLHILPKKKAYLVWLLVTMLFSYQSVLRILPNLLSESIMSKFSIGGDQFGWISGIFYVSYGILHLPYAIMFQRLSARKVLFISSFLMSFSILLMALANNWVIVVISRALLGGGAVGATIGAATLIRVSNSRRYEKQ